MTVRWARVLGIRWYLRDVCSVHSTEWGNPRRVGEDLDNIYLVGETVGLDAFKIGRDFNTAEQ